MPFQDFFIAESMAGTLIANFNIDGTIRLSWGVNGYLTLPPCGSGHAMHMLSNGKIFFVHAGYDYDATHYVQAAMLNDDGSLDNTWAYNGHYVTDDDVNDYRWAQSEGINYKILECTDGQLIVFAKGTNYCIHKLNSAGVTQIVKTGNDIDPFLNLRWPTDAIWSDDTKTRLLVSFNAKACIVALDPATLTLDATWGGLGGTPGMVKLDTQEINSITRVSDGIIAGVNRNFTWDDEIIVKINSAGTALVNTFGTNGKYIDATKTGVTGWQKIVIDSSENIYLLDYDATFVTSYVLKISPAGVLLDSIVYNTPGLNFTIHRLFIVNDILYLCTTKNAPAQFRLERYDTDLVFLDGVDPAGWGGATDFINDFLVDSYTYIPAGPGGGGRTLIKGKPRGSMIEFACHTGHRNVYG